MAADISIPKPNTSIWRNNLPLAGLSSVRADPASYVFIYKGLLGQRKQMLYGLNKMKCVSLLSAPLCSVAQDIVHEEECCVFSAAARVRTMRISAAILLD